jgi:hypothetical protein
MDRGSRRTREDVRVLREKNLEEAQPANAEHDSLSSSRTYVILRTIQHPCFRRGRTCRLSNTCAFRTQLAIVSR